MSSQTNAYNNVFDSVAESVWQVEESSWIDEVGGGEALSAQGEAMRGLLLNCVKEQRRSKLNDAMEAYLKASTEIQKQTVVLPDTAEAKRALLDSLLLSARSKPAGLTLQHRDFKNLSEADVESLLKHLVQLGLVEKGK